MALRALSLCAGIGGIDIGLARIGAAETVCYVERDPFAVRCLVRGIERGSLSDAPIWDDVRTFESAPWRGIVSLVTAGFPCQPFSTASRGRRVAFNLWPDCLRIIRELEPRFVLLENVQRAPIERAAKQLERFGFACRFEMFDASGVGAAHRRPRWWLLAHTHDSGEPALAFDAEMARVSAARQADEWSSGPGRVLGMDVRIRNRSHRLRALGNAVVPQVAALAWQELSKKQGAMTMPPITEDVDAAHRANGGATC